MLVSLKTERVPKSREEAYKSERARCPDYPAVVYLLRQYQYSCIRTVGLERPYLFPKIESRAKTSFEILFQMLMTHVLTVVR